MSSYLLKGCQDGDAFELRPQRRQRLDLPATLAWLLQRGFREVVDAGVMVIVERECAVNIYASGRMLLRTSDREVADTLAAELCALLEGHQ